MAIENKIAWGIFTCAMVAAVIKVAKKRKEMQEESGASGIGAAKKRRIYKELSLAQQAGVDFTKAYDELDPEEIEALERVSSETGYTETYYKSLQKAYNAVSGIGEAYDVVDAEGNTVLTWVEDPDANPNTWRSAYDPERDRAYLDAREIEEAREWETENKAREIEEREARLAEQRKRLRKAGRSSQMALFGCGTGALNTRDLLEPDLLDYVRRNVDEYDVQEALDEIGENRSSLQHANNYLYDKIYDLTEEWCVDNAIDPETIWDLVDPEDIFWEL